MVIGLTGGIGSGKTTAAKLFETMGCMIYNSDEKAKEVYFNALVKEQVVALLGEKAYSNPATLNKAYISDKIFSNEQLLLQLNAIIHPAVKNDFDKFAQQFAQRIIIKESAILFETGIYKDLDATILIVAPLEERMKRVMKRSAASRSDVEMRMKSQWMDEVKIPLANYLLHNTKSQALIPQALSILNQLNSHVKA